VCAVLKIGVFHPSLDLYGGAEVVAVVVANTLVENNHDVTLFVNNRINQKQVEEMIGERVSPSIRAVINQPFLNPRGIFHLYESAIRSRVFKSKCDVLIDTYSCCVFPWIDVSYIHFPYINNYEFSPRFPYLKTPHLRQIIAVPYVALEKNLENFDDKLILTNSEFTAKATRESLKTNSDVLYPPIPQTFYADGVDAGKRREDLVVTTARFGQGKGVELVPEIAGFTEKGIKFVMIGLAHDINVVEQVKRSVKRLELEDRVKIITNASRKEIKSYLAKAKIYLHTTKMEHFGISIAEAMAMGCLPVVHDSGGAPEFVPDRYRYKSTEEAAEIIKIAINGWSAKESDYMKHIAQRFSEDSFKKKFIESFSKYITLWEKRRR